MNDISSATAELVALARSIVDRWDEGSTQFDSFDTDLAEFQCRIEDLVNDPIAMARLIAARDGSGRR